MRSVRSRAITAGLVLVVAGVGAWQLLPSGAGGRDAVTVGTTDVASSLDPAGAYDAGSWALYSNIYQSLLTIKPGAADPEPDAASSCRFIGQKLTTYQCEVREGLKFSNGREITAEDVKYSFDRIKKINSDQGPAPLLNTLKSVTAKDRTVTFNLSARDATFPFKIATGAGSIVDSSKYPADALRTGDGADGSGPYVLKSFDKGKEAELAPNESYKGPVKPAHVPVNVRYFTDAEGLDAAWQSRDVDVAHRDLPPQVLAGLRPGLEDTRYQQSGGSETRNLVFNVRKGSPVEEQPVRRAVAAVLDRAKIASEVYQGTVTPLYSLIPQGVGGHGTPFFDSYPEPSADRAKEILRAADISTPVSFTLGFNSRGTTAAEAAEIKKQLESSGLFKVKTEGVAEWPEFQKAYAAGKFDAYTIGWIADFPDPDNFTAPLVGSDSSMNNGFRDRRIDTLITRTQSYSDRAMAASDFRDLQKEVAEQVPMLPIWQKKDFVVSREAVTGAQYLSDGTGVWRLWELNWL
ncbi:ABC transporter substrate-binding protein [Streptomyces sp. NPDC097619]|uniref:ABC transporter substrate-binding protein n=1 Tax=Streptomyces sp. NPDC097619 TaxID=3157228 RepID=UPI0033279E77